MSRSPTAGNRGQGSNWCSKAKRARIYQRDQYTCVWCGAEVYIGEGLAPDVRASIDHLVPRCMGGNNDAQNLVTSCMRDNVARGGRPALEYAVEVGGVDRYPIMARIVRAVSTPTQKAKRKCKSSTTVCAL